MCGIFLYLYDNVIHDKKLENIIKESFNNSQHRGPDSSNIVLKQTNRYNIFSGFHRLAINDISIKGNQPFLSETEDIICMCNGEIYNSGNIIKKFGLKMNSNSDCEVIFQLYMKYKGELCFNVENIAKILDGVFAFYIIDLKLGRIWIGRDPIGVRSLYWSGVSLKNKNDSINSIFGLSSEIKSINNLCDKIEPFPPGTTVSWNLENNSLIQMTKYYNLPLYNDSFLNRKDIIEKQIECLSILRKCVKKRMLSDRPIGCFLSGGLDSSVICGLVAENYKNKKDLHTFSIGMENSPDLINARKVADFVGTSHHEIVVTQDELLNSVETTIKQIESYDTTTVRASTPMYYLSKYIKRQTDLDITVIFSGEGVDEIAGSYLYFKNYPSKFEFDKECKRLVDELHCFDVLRGDKCTAGSGLEIRVPFLDKSFVSFYLNLPVDLRIPHNVETLDNKRNSIEKYFLRKCFENENIIPKEIVNRQKEAFSDGISKIEESWYQILQTNIEEIYSEEDLYYGKLEYRHNTPNTKEQLHYRNIFHKYYPNNSNIIPHFWTPLWSNTEESSARTLEVYT